MLGLEGLDQVQGRFSGEDPLDHASPLEKNGTTDFTDERQHDMQRFESV
jgi:hypothetical protein